jgi:hypothetical protein
VQVFCGGDDETFEMRSGKQSVDIVITTKDSRTESPVPWQDYLVIEEGGGEVHSVSLTQNRKMKDNTDRSDTKKRSLSALGGGSRKADEELLGGTYLAGLTRDLLVALDLKSSRDMKRMRTARRGVWEATHLRHSAQEISPRFRFISISLENMPS